MFKSQVSEKKGQKSEKKHVFSEILDFLANIDYWGENHTEYRILPNFANFGKIQIG